MKILLRSEGECLSLSLRSEIGLELCNGIQMEPSLFFKP